MWWRENMKSIFASKTFWINTVVIGTTWFLNHKGIMASAGLDADTQVSILALVNLINRWFTHGSVNVAG